MSTSSVIINNCKPISPSVHGLQVGWLMLRSISFGFPYAMDILCVEFSTFYISYISKIVFSLQVCQLINKFICVACKLFIVIMLITLMEQACIWELNDSSINCHLHGGYARLPIQVLSLAMGPLLWYFFITIFGTKTHPSLITFLQMVLLFLWLTLAMLFSIP
jgi:hypothetical protein